MKLNLNLKPLFQQWWPTKPIRYETVARQTWERQTGLPSGRSHAGRVYVEIHTLSTGIEYDLRILKWPPDLYPLRFKGLWRQLK